MLDLGIKTIIGSSRPCLKQGCEGQMEAVINFSRHRGTGHTNQIMRWHCSSCNFTFVAKKVAAVDLDTPEVIVGAV